MIASYNLLGVHLQTSTLLLKQKLQAPFTTRHKEAFCCYASLLRRLYYNPLQRIMVCNIYYKTVHSPHGLPSPVTALFRDIPGLDLFYLKQRDYV